jgi:hypothetical protein
VVVKNDIYNLGCNICIFIRDDFRVFCCNYHHAKHARQYLQATLVSEMDMLFDIVCWADSGHHAKLGNAYRGIS